jgi:hypothetical protein
VKSATFRLAHEAALKNCLNVIAQAPLDGSIEVVIRPAGQGKTMAQLGGLFASWVKYIADEAGESEDYIHRMLKARFLARIYAEDQQNALQEQWVELLAHYQETGQQEKLYKHAKRISLSWATKSQMSRYMEAIEHHYQAEGLPLPILDKFRDCYK